LVAFLAIWLFVALPLISSSQAPQFSRQPEYSNPANTQSERSKSLGQKTTEDPTAFFTACVALFTFILAVSTIGLWIVTWRIAVSTKKRDETLERAYLWPGFGESREFDDGQGREWRIRVWNSGKTVGVLQEVCWAIVEPGDFEAGKKIKYTPYTGREDLIPPSLGKPNEIETGIIFETYRPMVCCGWIVWEDIFGNIQKQGWKHTLYVKKDVAGNSSIPFPGAYSRKYRPWEEEGA
jgi:hypothetical protein